MDSETSESEPRMPARSVCLYSRYLRYCIRKLFIHGLPNTFSALCNPGCLNGGSCIRPNVCSCPVGYTGPTCETGMCLNKILGREVYRRSTLLLHCFIPNLKHKFYGWFTLWSKTLYSVTNAKNGLLTWLIVPDVDECATRASNKCHQNCVNTIGSYECSCYEGFQLQDDRKSCKCTVPSQSLESPLRASISARVNFRFVFLLSKCENWK